ncbi:MAG: pirin family protein [Gemmataceae bacterium]|nr:pirin family protein [Gemmataceae bacterium]MCI0640242.1 pirin family protein [Gemmataceae bacterium]MCI0743578.1 pirin family protein [Gemmataceae bacterium]
MITFRKSHERGHFNHGWLDTYHTFSFADYYDPKHHHFQDLRVINEDRVAPGQGFGMHPHRDMEILTYVLEGALEHRDSLGNGEVLRAGELQRMTAGSGIMHSEFNPSEETPVHLYQIWLFPKAKGLKPSYEQKRFEPEKRQDRWQLAASPDGAGGALTIQQDTRVYLARPSANQSLEHPLTPGRHAWLQVIRGKVGLGEHALSAGDAAALSDERTIRIAGQSDDAEVMLFDLP